MTSGVKHFRLHSSWEKIIIGDKMQRNLLFTAMIIIILSGCSLPENPGLPTWETKLSFYILNDNYDLLELAEEDSSIVLITTTEGDTVLGIFQEEVSEQEIEIGATESTQEYEEAEIGDIELPDVDDVESDLTFGEFSESAGLILPGQGQTVPFIEPFHFDNIRQEMDAVEKIEVVEILVGGFFLRLTNNMIVVMGDYEADDPLKVRIVNITESDTIDVVEEIELTDTNLAPGESYQTWIDLSGRTLYREMSVLLSGGSQGTSGQPTVIDYETLFISELEFDDGLTASAAESMIAEQTIIDTIFIDFDDDYKIYFAQLLDDESYRIDISIVNEIDLDLNLLVEIPDLFLDSDSHYINEIFVPRSSAGGEYDISLALGGARIGDNQNLLETLDVFTIASIDSTETGDFRTITATDKYHVTTEMSSVEFDYVRGVIKPQEQDLISEEVTIDVDYPEVEEGADFMFVGESSIKINVMTGESFIPGTMTIYARAFSQSGDMVELIDSESGNPPLVIIPPETEFDIEFSSEEYNINELLSILPERIEFDVDVQIGNGASEVVYNRGDLLETIISIESTLALASEAWVIPTDNGEISINEEEIELSENEYDAFQSASLTITYKNTTGLNVAADILMAENKADIAQEIYHYNNADTTKVNLIRIPMLEETTAEETKELNIDILQKDLSYFLSDYTYLSSRLKLVSEGTQPLSGGVEMLVKAEIVIKISQSLLEDEEN